MIVITTSSLERNRVAPSRLTKLRAQEPIDAGLPASDRKLRYSKRFK